MTETLDCVVIGAGVVGLAVARALAMKGRDVIVLEAENAIGTGTSSRNSEVIHAGLYYPKDSLKARLCVAGNRALRDFCAGHGVPFSMTGKLIVATDEAENASLDALLAKGDANGVTGLRRLDLAEARALEPELACTGALFSADTGIVDSHALMLALQGEAEDYGAMLALMTPVLDGEITEDGVLLRTGGRDGGVFACKTVVNCAGLGAHRIATSLAGLRPETVPPHHLCKGNYFLLSGRTPFRHLVYPVPVAAGLGIHFTLDLAGQGRFGPDVEWLSATDCPDLAVTETKAAGFAAAIRRYWPGLADEALRPGYAGVRPKIQAPGEAAADFAILGPAHHGCSGYIGLHGIESPGLTACLAIADLVGDMCL